MNPHPRGNTVLTVFNELRDDILNGEYAPGEALVEEAVASKYEVSRTPVRSALALLAQEGLVSVTRSGSGAFVRAISVRDVVEIFELRQAVESFAIAHGTGRLDRAALGELATAAPASPQQPPSGPEILLYSTDTEFHRLILDGWGNEHASRTLRIHSQQLSRVRALLWRAADPLVDAHMTERNVQASLEHRQIATLLLAGEVEQAREQLVEHLELGRNSMIQLMMSVSFDSASQTPRRAPAERRPIPLGEI